MGLVCGSHLWDHRTETQSLPQRGLVLAVKKAANASSQYLLLLPYAGTCLEPQAAPAFSLWPTGKGRRAENKDMIQNKNLIWSWMIPSIQCITTVSRL